MTRVHTALVLLAMGCSGAASTADGGNNPPAVDSGSDATPDTKDARGQVDEVGIDATTCGVGDAANIPDVVAFFPVDGGVDVGCESGLCASSVSDPVAEARSSVCRKNVWCGAASCGNGVRDTCALCRGPCAPAGAFTEVCDGADLAGKTCATLGYGSGALGCGTDCNYDVSSCAICSALGPQLLSCGATPLAPPGEVASLSISASDDQTAVVWSLAYEGGVYLALYDRDLRLVTNVGPIAHTGATELPVAATPEGWVVAVPRLGELTTDLLTLSSCGTVIGSVALPDTTAVALAAEPGKYPLVAWIEYMTGSAVGSVSTIRAGRIAADGRAVPASVALFADNFVDGGGLSATFAGDGFLVAGSTAGGVTIARVEADGSFDGTLQKPFGADTEFPRLASDGVRTEIAYFGFGAPTTTTFLASLDRTGVAVSAPRSLEATTSVLALAIGTDSRPVVLAADVGIILQALPLRTDDTPDAPVSLGGDPEGIGIADLGRRGSDLVAAWIGGGCEGRPQLARVAP